MEDSFALEKASGRGVTLASYARQFAMAAPSFKMIVNGDRNLTVANIHRIARVFKMTPGEWDYFEALVLRDQSADEDAYSFYDKRLKRLRKHARLGHRRTNDKRFIATSISSSLLVYLMDIEGVGRTKSVDEIDRARVAQRFGVSRSVVDDLLSAINSAGSLARGEKDQLHIVFDRINRQLDEKEYVLTEMRAAVQKIESEFSVTENFFRAFTLTMDKKDLPLLRSDLIALLESYMAKDVQAASRKVVEKIVIAAYPAVLC